MHRISALFVVSSLSLVALAASESNRTGPDVHGNLCLHGRSKTDPNPWLVSLLIEQATSMGRRPRPGSRGRFFNSNARMALGF